MSSDPGDRGTRPGPSTGGVALWRAAAGAPPAPEPPAPEPPAERGPAMWLAAAGVTPPRRAAERPAEPPPGPVAKPRVRYVRPDGAPLPVAPQDRPSGVTDRYQPFTDSELGRDDAVTREVQDVEQRAAMAPSAPPVAEGLSDVARDLLAGAFDKVDESSHLGDDWNDLFIDEDGNASLRASKRGGPREAAGSSSTRAPGQSHIDPLERANLQLAGDADSATSAPTAPPSDMPSDAGTWARDAERLAEQRASSDAAHHSAFPRFGEDLELAEPSADFETDEHRPGTAFARVALVASPRPPSEVRERWSGQERPGVEGEPGAVTDGSDARQAPPRVESEPAAAPEPAPLAAGVIRRRRTSNPSQPLDAVADDVGLELIERAEQPAPTDAAPQRAARPESADAPVQGAGVLKRRVSSPPSRPAPATTQAQNHPASSSDTDRASAPLAGAGVLRRRRATTGAHTVPDGDGRGDPQK